MHRSNLFAFGILILGLTVAPLSLKAQKAESSALANQLKEAEKILLQQQERVARAEKEVKRYEQSVATLERQARDRRVAPWDLAKARREINAARVALPHVRDDLSAADVALDKQEEKLMQAYKALVETRSKSIEHLEQRLSTLDLRQNFASLRDEIGDAQLVANKVEAFYDSSLMAEYMKMKMGGMLSSPQFCAAVDNNCSRGRVKRGAKAPNMDSLFSTPEPMATLPEGANSKVSH